MGVLILNNHSDIIWLAMTRIWLSLLGLQTTNPIKSLQLDLLEHRMPIVEKMWHQDDSPTNGCQMTSLIARIMGPTWGPSGADRSQVGPMLAPWSLLSGMPYCDSDINICRHRPIVVRHHVVEPLRDTACKMLVCVVLWCETAGYYDCLDPKVIAKISCNTWNSPKPR